MYASLPPWLRELLPILILLVVIAVVVRRLPRVDVGHSDAFRTRRFLNWFPAGMTYAFLYMGRYNITAFKNAVSMSNDAYGTIDLWGSLIYGVAFLNPPPAGTSLVAPAAPFWMQPLVWTLAALALVLAVLVRRMTRGPR